MNLFCVFIACSVCTGPGFIVGVLLTEENKRSSYTPDRLLDELTKHEKYNE